ncbi:MAG: DUF1338 domain-containing protein [Cyanosarcina radialis HA8281-LM2]|nr:DUF1338 domain-containing protein [Cyanosarcina radialis HA8281-LM2]
MKNIQIARLTWAKLWEDYSRRVPYARTYQQAIEAAGGTLANDHIAFRSLRLTADTPKGKIELGIPYIGRIVEALGYKVAGEYEFPEQQLYALHYQHPDQDEFDLPKLFVSELLVDALPEKIADVIAQIVASGQFFNSQTLIEDIAAAFPETELDRIATRLQEIFIRPWEPPQKSIVEAVNQVTQYGAWVLLHGYAVNHFTGYVNRQQTPRYPDIASTARALAELGIPMKAKIEGSVSTGLQQTATQAAIENVLVRDDSTGELIKIPWTYAYYEIAERHPVEVAPGAIDLFQGFLSSQAKNLFEMTRKG